MRVVSNVAPPCSQLCGSGFLCVLLAATRFAALLSLSHGTSTYNVGPPPHTHRGTIIRTSLAAHVHFPTASPLPSVHARRGTPALSAAALPRSAACWCTAQTRTTTRCLTPTSTRPGTSTAPAAAGEVGGVARARSAVMAKGPPMPNTHSPRRRTPDGTPPIATIPRLALPTPMPPVMPLRSDCNLSSGGQGGISPKQYRYRQVKVHAWQLSKVCARILSSFSAPFDRRLYPRGHAPPPPFQTRAHGGCMASPLHPTYPPCLCASCRPG